MKLPNKIPRELLGLIVDKVHDSAIEDCDVITDTYQVIADYFNNQAQVFDWKSIDELPVEPMPILLYVKSKTGRNIYLPAKILDTKDERFCFIATEGGISSQRTIKIIYTHYAPLTPPSQELKNE